MSLNHRSGKSTRSRGFSLVEVLVALLILAFGLLGLASLQLFGLRNNQTALYRSQATQMSYDIVDRIRVNPTGFANGNYDKPAGFANGDYDAGTTASAIDCIANNCTPAVMAEYDLAQWNLGIKDITLGLPQGVGVVCIDSSPNDGTVIAGALTHGCDGNGNVYAVKIWWDERDPDRPQAQGHNLFVMSFQL